MSEPETQTIVSLLDTVPSISFFVDLHSYGEDILYSWGDRREPVRRPSMGFQNAAHDGDRGVDGDTYREFITSTDESRSIAMANAMATAIQGVRGRSYLVEARLPALSNLGRIG